MALSAGTRLGPYDILSPLGAGGMGEVYRARDARLGRDVAIKVLPADVAGDADRRARFEREAHAVAALSHPNILAIFDIGREGDHLYVVTELLEGETLANRLTQGALPVRKATEIAIAIARGLSAAHGKGIAHRDLKPANVFLLADGQVKILDFGLAKVTAPEVTSASETRATLTDAGTVLGTAGYMAPEQIRRHAVDGRADLFALGAVLYEMLTGQRAFARETTAETLTAVLREDPPEMTLAGADLPNALDRIVRHCLEKNPAVRFQSSQDVIFALETIDSGGSSSAARAAVAEVQGSGRVRNARVAWAAAIVVALIAGLGAGVWMARSPLAPADADLTSQPSFRRLTFRRGSVNEARFTRDGHTVVYGARWDGGPPDLHVTSTDNPESRALGINGYLADLSGAAELAVLLSPRTWAGINSITGTLARAPLNGGVPRSITDEISDADFSPDGKETAVVRRTGGRFSLEYPVGAVLYESGFDLISPRVSPDGRLVAFVEGGYGGALKVAGRDQPGRTLVTGLEFNGLNWSPDGRELWFVSAGERRDFQLSAMDMSGRRRPLLSAPGGFLLKDVSVDGRVLVDRWMFTQRTAGMPPGSTAAQDFSWHDYTRVSDLSPNGAVLVFTEYGASAGSAGATYVRKTDGSPPVHLGRGMFGRLSPDGQLVAAIRDERDIVLLPTGSGKERTLGLKFEEIQGVAWMPDGRRFLLSGRRLGETRRLYLYDLNQNQMRPVSPEGVGMDDPFVGQLRVSPDGRFTAARDADGRVAIVTLDDGRLRPLPGVQTGEVPLGWTADGQSIYAFTPQVMPARVFRINVESGRRDLWRDIVPRETAGVPGIYNVVITPDGRSWFYSFQQALSELYVVDGLK